MKLKKKSKINMAAIRNMRELRLMRQKLIYQEKLYEKEFSTTATDLSDNLSAKVRDFAFDFGSRMIIRVISYLRKSKNETKDVEGE